MTFTFLGSQNLSLMPSVNCRRQKMKCRIDSGNTCRRCDRAGLPCIFIPRANASAFMVPASLPLAEMASYDVTRDILRRVKAIEDHLGLHEDVKSTEAHSAAPYTGEPIDKNSADDLAGPWSLWRSTACLERCAPTSHDPALWKKSTVRHLFQT